MLTKADEGRRGVKQMLTICLRTLCPKSVRFVFRTIFLQTIHFQGEAKRDTFISVEMTMLATDAEF